MQTTHPYEIGDVHEFQFQMNDHAPLVVRARVAHAMRATVHHEALYLFGLEFLEADAGAIEALIASLRAD